MILSCSGQSVAELCGHTCRVWYWRRYKGIWPATNGECGDAQPLMAPDTLRELAKSFKDETAEVKLQVRPLVKTRVALHFCGAPVRRGTTFAESRGTKH